MDSDLFPAFVGIIPGTNEFKENGITFTYSGAATAIPAPVTPAPATQPVTPVTPAKPKPPSIPVDRTKLVSTCVGYGSIF